MNITVEIAISEYARNHSKKETYLYNNRIHCFSRGDGNIEIKNKEQYNANWEWINKLPK